MENTTRRTNTIQTVLSENGADSLGIILHWFWDEADHDGFTAMLMDVLAVYVEHYPNNVLSTRKPERITRFISDLIQLKEQLIDVINEEKPWEWVVRRTVGDCRSRNKSPAIKCYGYAAFRGCLFLLGTCQNLTFKAARLLLNVNICQPQPRRTRWTRWTKGRTHWTTSTPGGPKWQACQNPGYPNITLTS